MVCFLGERGRAVFGCAVGVGLGEGMQTSLPSAGFVVFAGGEPHRDRKEAWLGLETFGGRSAPLAEHLPWDMQKGHCEPLRFCS